MQTLLIMQDIEKEEAGYDHLSPYEQEEIDERHDWEKMDLERFLMAQIYTEEEMMQLIPGYEPTPAI